MVVTPCFILIHIDTLEELTVSFFKVSTVTTDLKARSSIALEFWNYHKFVLKLPE